MPSPRKWPTTVCSSVNDRLCTVVSGEPLGEQILLDPPRTGWGVGLWLVPLLIGGLGVWAILGLRRRNATSGESVETEREDVTP